MGNVLTWEQAKDAHGAAEVDCPCLSTVAALVGGLGLPCPVKGEEGGWGEYIVLTNLFPVEVFPPRLFVSFARPSPLEERLSAIAEAVLLFASCSPLTGRACLLFVSLHTL